MPHTNKVNTKTIVVPNVNISDYDDENNSQLK